jgi:hypothetical protein
MSYIYKNYNQFFYLIIADGDKIVTLYWMICFLNGDSLVTELFISAGFGDNLVTLLILKEAYS